MTTFGANEVYQELGVRRVINAQGNRTDLGGSIVAKTISKAMDDANEHYVEMRELLDKSGDYIASTLGVEAAYVTSGCAAALTLSTAACLTGVDLDKRAPLPNTTGMKNEVLIQKKQRYPYDRCFTLTGATLVEVGDENGCTLKQLEAAINANTVAVAYLARRDWDSSVVPLEEAVTMAHKNGTPVIVDAAAQVYPLDYFRQIAQSADLVCFGAKYLGAPHSTGIVCGKRERVEAVAAHGFIGFETWGSKAVGRPMKVDRQEVIGVVAALKLWISMNHEDRLLTYDTKFAAIQKALQEIPYADAEIVPTQSTWPFRLEVVLNTPVLGINSKQLRKELDEGNPRIRVGVRGDDTITINVHELNEGEEKIIVDRLRNILTKYDQAS